MAILYSQRHPDDFRCFYDVQSHPPTESPVLRPRQPFVAPKLRRLPAAHHRTLLRLLRPAQGMGTKHPGLHPDAYHLHLHAEQPHYMAAVQASFRKIPCRIKHPVHKKIKGDVTSRYISFF